LYKIGYVSTLKKSQISDTDRKVNPRVKVEVGLMEKSNIFNEGGIAGQVGLDSEEER